MQKMIAIYPEKCTACRSCELACSRAKAAYLNPLESHVRVHIFFDEAIYFPLMCRQCEDAPCMGVCPSGAIARDAEPGLVRVSADKCIGCKMCMVACPFGLMNFSPSERHAAKCDLCEGDPECVKFCIPGAIEYRAMDTATVARMRDFASKLKGLALSGQVQSL